MSNGPRDSRYDTSPLGRPDTNERPEFDTEGPTRPMQPEQPGAQPPQPQPTRITSPQPQGPDSYATHNAPPMHGAYMPPPPHGWMEPPNAAPLMQQPPQTMPQRSIAAQLGITPNFAGMACYIPFIGIVASIVLLMGEPKESRFLQFHAKQSLIAHIAFWALTLSFNAMRGVMPGVISILLAFPQAVMVVAGVAGFVYMMVTAYRWRTVKIPVIGGQVE